MECNLVDPLYFLQHTAEEAGFQGGNNVFAEGAGVYPVNNLVAFMNNLDIDAKVSDEVAAVRKRFKRRYDVKLPSSQLREHGHGQVHVLVQVPIMWRHSSLSVY